MLTCVKSEWERKLRCFVWCVRLLICNCSNGRFNEEPPHYRGGIFFEQQPIVRAACLRLSERPDVYSSSVGIAGLIDIGIIRYGQFPYGCAVNSDLGLVDTASVNQGKLDAGAIACGSRHNCGFVAGVVWGLRSLQPV